MTPHGAKTVLHAEGISKTFPNGQHACRKIDITVRAGEVVGIVGESGSGKSTLLRCLGGLLPPDDGRVMLFDGARDIEIWALGDVERERFVGRSVGFVQQNPRDGLRMEVSSGGNIAEDLLVDGIRHYGTLRDTAVEWLRKVELAEHRIDEPPTTFSGGMQQRLQIARSLVRGPRLLLMDEPTGGLDVSVQARILDLLRRLVRELDLAVVVVTHDLAVARMLAQRLLVMRRGKIAETGLTDQVLEDPQHCYTQSLVSAALRL